MLTPLQDGDGNQFLEMIPGIDLASGLRYAGGDRKLYVSILRKFATQQRTFPEVMREALQQADWALAERTIHTLKGLAAVIGATALQELAQKFEASIKLRSPHEVLENQLKLLQITLDVLLKEINTHFSPEVHLTHVYVDFDLLESVCKQLVGMLSEYSAEAGPLFHRHEQLLHSAYPIYFQAIKNSIETFDFAKALMRLQEAIGKEKDG